MSPFLYSGIVKNMTMKGWTALELLLEQEGKDSPGMAMKVFVPKHKNIKLEDYSVDPGSSFWEKVEKIQWEDMKGKKCLVDADKVEELAKKSSYPNQAMLGKVLKDLRRGQE